MSLVGSLEDLGLTDILQIVSLARKSGRLLLRAGNDAGRIVLCDGLVRAAAIKGEGEDLRSLLVDGGVVPEDDFGRASEWADGHGRPLREAVVEVAGLAQERLDALRREHVEQAILRMFTWRNGEFSFEVRDEVDPEDAELLLPTGINTQYLAMEATRLRDEGGAPEAPSGALFDLDDMPMFSGESFGSDATSDAQSPSTIVDTIAIAAARAADEAEEACAEELPTRPTEIPVVQADAAVVEVAIPVGPPVVARPVVALDTDLTGLEWFKASAGDCVPRVHIFQRVDLAVERIRQYLARGVVPLVVAGPRLLERNADPTLLGRLRAVAPGIRVLALLERGSDPNPPEGFDGIVERPAALAADPELWGGNESVASALRRTLVEFAGAAAAASAPPDSSSRAALDRLREVSDRMRDPSGRHDVLSLVLEFAAGQFARVAVFMIRDDGAVGMARQGFESAAGGHDPGPVELELLTGDLPPLFGRALEARRGVSGELGPCGSDIAAWLGSESPQQAYVGPIESAGGVAALLYADHLPERRPIGETTALEVVLHEAGLALDRAVLERTLAGVEAS